jgi:hypothetical protein
LERSARQINEMELVSPPQLLTGTCRADQQVFEHERAPRRVVAIRFTLKNGAMTWLEYPVGSLPAPCPANRHSPFEINHVARRAVRRRIEVKR